MDPSSLHVLGCGSIGLLFASYIRRQSPKTKITLLLRPHHRAKLFAPHYNQFECHLQLPQKNNPVQRVLLPVEILSDKDTNQSKIETLLLCTKAPDASLALSSISHRLQAEKSNVVLLSNGALALKKELHARFPDVSFVLASTTHGAHRPSYSNIIHAGVGTTYVQDKRLAQLFDTCGLNAKYVTSNDIQILLWHKLAANCVINPLTALYKVTNGALSQKYLPGDDSKKKENLQHRIEQILKEVSAVALAEYSQQELDNIASDDSDNNRITQELSFERLFTFVNQVIQQTSSNQSSMLQDILSKRPKTEIHYLNGYICDLGKIHGIPTPENQRLYDDITSLVENYHYSNEQSSCS